MQNILEKAVLHSTEPSDTNLDKSQPRTRGKKRKGAPIASRRGKPGTSHSNFVVTDADRNLYSTEVMDIMARSVLDVAKEISVFRTKNNYKIRQIVDSNPVNLDYTYCYNWLVRPNTAQKHKICGIYQWYVTEKKKVNCADSVESNSSVDNSIPALNL